MNKLFNIAKVTGFVSLLALMLVSAMPATGHASNHATPPTVSSADAAAASRDCAGGSDLCFIRVNDDGSQTYYYLGPLLSSAQ
jgi:hypothetical protein